MYHLLSCECGREIAVTRKQAGQELECECGRRLRVPTLRGFSELAPAGASPALESPQAASRAEQARSVWSGWRGPAMALATAVFVIAGVATARYAYHRVSVDTSYTAQTEVAAGAEVFDRATPEDLSLVWNDYQQLRLGVKDRPIFYQIAQFARDREISAAISGGISLLAGLAAGGIWLTARRKTHQAR